jgi:hypothetical protein
MTYYKQKRYRPRTRNKKFSGLIKYVDTKSAEGWDLQYLSDLFGIEFLVESPSRVGSSSKEIDKRKLRAKSIAAYLLKYM